MSDIKYRKIEVAHEGTAVWLDFSDKNNIKIVDSNDMLDEVEIADLLRVVQDYKCKCTSSAQTGQCQWCIDQWGVNYGTKN